MEPDPYLAVSGLVVDDPSCHSLGYQQKIRRIGSSPAGAQIDRYKCAWYIIRRDRPRLPLAGFFHHDSPLTFLSLYTAQTYPPPPQSISTSLALSLIAILTLILSIRSSKSASSFTNPILSCANLLPISSILLYPSGRKSYCTTAALIFRSWGMTLF
jgi:hypothetical protein